VREEILVNAGSPLDNAAQTAAARIEFSSFLIFQWEVAMLEQHAEIEGLRRKRKRVLLLLVLFIVLMPVGCVGPFTLFSVAPKSFQTPLFIAAGVLPLVGLAGTLLMLGDRSKASRSLALAEKAQQMGLGFVERPKPDEYRWLEKTESYGAADKHMGGATC
jgi:hypothetical protein